MLLSLSQVKNVLIDIRRNDTSVKELIKNVNLTDCLNDRGDAQVSKLLDKLKHNYNMPIESTCHSDEDHEILYLLQKGQIYVNCGNDPINEDIVISREDLGDRDIIIKTNEIPVSLIHKLMSEEVN